MVQTDLAIKENMFSVPIVKIKCDDWITKKSKLLEFCKNLDSFENIKTDFFSKEKSQEIKLIELIHNLFSFELTLFCKVMSFYEVNVGRAWFEESSYGNFHDPHMHGSVGYSSVCYLTYDKSAHTATKFISPFVNFHNGDSVIYTPDVTEGDMIFFPSSILHYTLPNKTYKARKILSYNMSVKHTI